jgi:hypothetical protein
MVAVPEHSATEADRMELNDLDGPESGIAQVAAEGVSVRHVAPGSISQIARRRRGSELAEGIGEADYIRAITTALRATPSHCLPATRITNRSSSRASCVIVLHAADLEGV